MDVRRLRVALFAFFLLPALGTAPAQDVPLRADQAAGHVGEVRTVCGQVVRAIYVPSANRQPTFLNLDKPYPSHIFTVVIFGKDRGSFPEPPERLYRDKRVCAKGKITLYERKPEIIAERPSQIHIVKQP